MTLESGKDSDAKKLIIRLPETRGDDELYLLDRAQIKALLSLSASIGWRTRHLAFPEYVNTKDKLQAFADETIVDLMTPQDFCALMIANAECFFDGDGVLDALINRLDNSDLWERIQEKIDNEKRTLPGSYSGSNLLGNTDCDPDKIFNVCYEIVTYLHAVSGQMFGILEQLSNAGERASLFASVLQSGSNTVSDEILSFMDKLMGEIKEEYDVRFILGGELHYAIACELFCAHRYDCALTVTGLLAYYLNKVNDEINALGDPLDVLDAFATYLMTGDLPLNLIPYSMHALCLVVINSNIPFFGNTFLNIQSLVRAESDESNNNWVEFCEDCNEPEPLDPECFDLTESRNGFTEQTGTTWSLGVGFQAAYLSLYNESILRIYYEGAAFPRYINKVVVTFSTPMTNVALYQQGGGVGFTYTGAPVTVMEFSQETIVGWTDYNPGFGLAVTWTATGNLTPISMPIICVYMVAP